LRQSNSGFGSGNEAAIALGNLVNRAEPLAWNVIEQYRSFVFQIGSETASGQLIRASMLPC